MSGGTGIVTGLTPATTIPGLLALDELVRRVRLRLNDNPFEDKHTDAMNAVTTDATMTVADGTKYARGNLIDWEEYPFERAMVESVSGNDVTLHRAHDGTTVAAHAINSRFLKDATWPAYLIAESITRCIQGDLFPWIWGVGTTTITPDNSNVHWYELPSDFIDPIGAMQIYGTVENVAEYGGRDGRPFMFKHGLPASLVSTGIGARFPYLKDNDADIEVTYRRLITVSGNVTTVEDGMMADAVVWGAIARMVADKDLTEMVDRTPTSRTGASIRNASWFRANFENTRDIVNAHLMATNRPMALRRR